jgi:hypothetical protein
MSTSQQKNELAQVIAYTPPRLYTGAELKISITYIYQFDKQYIIDFLEHIYRPG